MALNMQQCRELFQAVEKSGLNPRECEFKNVLTDDWTHVTHIQTGDRLAISKSSDSLSAYWIERNLSAFRLAWKYASTSPEYHDWAYILTTVEDWAGQIAAATRDIWTEQASPGTAGH